MASLQVRVLFISQIILGALWVTVMSPSLSMGATFNNIRAVPIYTPPAAYVAKDGAFEKCSIVTLKNPPAQAKEALVYPADCIEAMISSQIITDSALRNSTAVAVHVCERNIVQKNNPRVANPYNVACIDALKVDGGNFWDKIQALHDQQSKALVDEKSPTVSQGEIKPEVQTVVPAPRASSVPDDVPAPAARSSTAS